MTDALDQAGHTGGSERYLGDLSAAARVLDGGGKRADARRAGGRRRPMHD